jgi:hypothetical protein
MWQNPLEAVAAGGAPSLPGISAKKMILGRWREPQLPWSSPRNFAPQQLEPKRGHADANWAVTAVHSWDAPTVFGDPVSGATSASRAAFTISTYLWLRHWKPVFQDTSQLFPTPIFHHRMADGEQRADITFDVHSGTTAIDWVGWCRLTLSNPLWKRLELSA